jgi:hypothetical protein
LPIAITVIEIVVDRRFTLSAAKHGEVAMGPHSHGRILAGAIANAVARALGVRIRDLPITRDRIIETIMNDNRA